MIWIIIVVLVCEVAVLLKLMLSYRQRAHRMFLVQDPLRNRIKRHRERLQELAQQIRQSSDEGVASLEREMAAQTLRCSFAANTVADLDAEAHEAQPEAAQDTGDADGEEDEEDEVEGIVGGRVGGAGVYTVDLDSERLHPVEMVQSIRHELEDAYEYMRGIRRDIGIIQHTTSRLGPAAGKDEKES